MSFTPGPWQSDSKKLVIRRGQGSKMGFAREAREDCYLVETANGGHRHIAFVRNRIDANAIAALPEMLKLLSEAWLLMDDALITQISDPEKGEDMSILCEKIDALLDKINGEE